MNKKETNTMFHGLKIVRWSNKNIMPIKIWKAYQHLCWHIEKADDAFDPFRVIVKNEVDAVH